MGIDPVIYATPMTNIETEQRRPLPISTMQLAGQASSDMIGGLGKTPLMLAVVVLNMIGIAAAVYFLNLLIAGQQVHLKALLDVQQGQFKELVVMHKAEFDALLLMVPKTEPASPSPPPGPPPRGAR